jgi:hypothetical protein
MKHVVAKPTVGEPLKIRRLDWAAKYAACAETDIVGKNQEHIRRSFWVLRCPWESQVLTLWQLFRSCPETASPVSAGPLAQPQLSRMPEVK